MANLFKAAKEKGATASGAPKKTEVVIKDPKFHLNLSRLADVNRQIDELSAESAVLNGEVKERSISEFAKLYESNGKYPGSFIIKAEGMKKLPSASLMFIPTDKYIKIGEERFEELRGTYGEEIVEETTTYTMDAKLIEQYGELLSDAISKIKAIPESDKKKLISAVTSYSIKKGTISELDKFRATIPEMLEEIKPVYQMKNVKIDDEE
jgi:hypothetical protein